MSTLTLAIPSKGRLMEATAALLAVGAGHPGDGHADVGARVPGSMPADSRTLDEEG